MVYPRCRSRLAVPALWISLLGSASGGCSDDGTEISDGGAARDAGEHPHHHPLPDAASDDDAGADAGTTPSATSTIEISARVRNEPLVCGQTYTLGPSVTPVRLIDFRFKVWDVRRFDTQLVEQAVVLVDAPPYQTAGEALLDFSDGSHDCKDDTAENHSLVIETPEEKSYGYAIRVGSLRLSLAVDGEQEPYVVELRGDVQANAHFHELDPARDVLVLDIDDLLAFVDLTDDGGGAFGCTGDTEDPECDAIYAQLGVIADGQGVHRVPQAFRIEPRAE